MLSENNDHAPMLDYSALDIPHQEASEPLPWRSTEAFEVYERLGLLEAQLNQQLEAERTERQGEVDALSQHFLKELAEVRAAQTTDGCQIASSQADIAKLEARLNRLKPSKTSPTLKIITQKQIMRLLMIVAAGLMGFAAIDRGDFRLTITPTGIFLLGGAGALLTLNHRFED